MIFAIPCVDPLNARMLTFSGGVLLLCRETKLHTLANRFLVSETATRGVEMVPVGLAGRLRMSERPGKRGGGSCSCQDPGAFLFASFDAFFDARDVDAVLVLPADPFNERVQAKDDNDGKSADQDNASYRTDCVEKFYDVHACRSPIENDIDLGWSGLKGDQLPGDVVSYHVVSIQHVTYYADCKLAETTFPRRSFSSYE